jgi:hypothetical protein
MSTPTNASLETSIPKICINLSPPSFLPNLKKEEKEKKEMEIAQKSLPRDNMSSILVGNQQPKTATWNGLPTYYRGDQILEQWAQVLSCPKNHHAGSPI